MVGLWHGVGLVLELFSICHYYYITRSFPRSFAFFIFVDKKAFFNVLYSCFSRLLHLCIKVTGSYSIRQNMITYYIFTRPIINSRGQLYIQEADYKFKRPIIYSRGRLYIHNGALSLVHWTNWNQNNYSKDQGENFRLGKHQASNYLFMKLASFRFYRPISDRKPWSLLSM